LFSLTKNFIKNNKQKVKIICSKHGFFEQRVDGHLKGVGCKKCADESYIIGPDKFIENSNKIHDNKYDYSLIYEDYINQHSKVKIICPKHGVFEQSASNHSGGCGCSVCKKDTKGQKSVRKYLKDSNLLFKEQKIFKDCKYKKYLLFDFYLLNNNICIEYDGQQHFESIEYFGGDQTFYETQIKDKIKNEYCKNNNIHLIRISYKENVSEKLNYELANILKSSILF
jgi:very-short-patch-repair endonuclease